MDKVLRFIPENPEFRPHDVNSMKSWFEAGWKVHASGGIAALELRGGEHQKGVTRLVTALMLQLSRVAEAPRRRIRHLKGS